MRMITNTNKTKVTIIKSKKITYDIVLYEESYLKEVPSYKHLGINIHHKLNWKYNI